MHTISFEEKFSQFSEQWAPRVVARSNGQLVKLAKVQGEFVWHSHADEDEIFIVVSGRLTIELRGGAIVLNAGEMTVVPAGVEHRPYAEVETHIILIEPEATTHTGDVQDERSKSIDQQPWI